MKKIAPHVFCWGVLFLPFFLYFAVLGFEVGEIVHNLDFVITECVGVSFLDDFANLSENETDLFFGRWMGAHFDYVTKSADVA